MAESKQKKEKNQNIQVFVRVRPINSREKEIKSYTAIETPNTKEVLVRQGTNDKQTKKFTYDRVFGPESKQIEVYTAVVHPLIEEVLSGYSCTVFAYGQTGTGKTFTMAGGNPAVNNSQDPSSWQDDPMAGVIPRCLNHLFDELRLMQVEFSIRVSYLELYNEELFDLLSPVDDTSKGIRIYDDPSKKGSVVVHGLEEIPVTSKNEVFKIMARGQEKRKTAATLMNAQSSRSHTVFSILLHIKENSIEGEEFIKSGKLNLVDLAGSENISKAGNDKRERAREAVNINQSLLTLGRVITALVERTPHIPYRESKLTRLLQDSLGGRTKTSIIATISPGHKDLDETLSTLDYAYRAKNIQNKPEVNQKITQKVVLKEYTEEIERLRRDLAANRDKNGVYLATETYNELHFKIEEQDREIMEKLLQIRAYEEDLEKRKGIYKSLTSTLAVKTEELEKTNEKLEAVNEELGITQQNLTKTKEVVLVKSHIIEKQVVTEKKLTQQAKKLVSVAEETCKDTKYLQDSLDKRRYIDKQIKTTAQTFGDKLHQQFNEIGHQNELFTECHTEFVDGITQKLDEYMQIHQRSSNELSSIMTCSKENQLKLINELESNINELKLSFTNKELENSQNIENKIEGLVQLLNTFKNNNLTPAVDKLNIIFKTEKNLLENMNESFNKQAKKSLDRIKELSNKQRGFCEDLETYVKNSFASQKDMIQDAVNKQAKIAEDEAKYNQLMSTKLKEFMQCASFLQETQFNHYNSIKHHVEKAGENLTEMENVTNDIESKISDTLQKNIKDNENFTDHFNKCHSDDVVNMNSLYLKLNQSNAARKSLYDELHKTTSQSIKEATGGLEDLETYQKVACKTSIDLVNKSVDETKELLQGAIDFVENSLVEHVDAVFKQNKFAVSAFSEQLDQQKIIQDKIDQFKTNSALQINTVRNSIDKYVSEDLKLYSPSGQTPVRKEYSYPKVLAATSPHEKISKMFRKMRCTMEDLAEDLNSSTDSVIDLTSATDCSNTDESRMQTARVPSPVEWLNMNTTAPVKSATSPVPLICKSVSEINLNNIQNDSTDTKENFKIPQQTKSKSDHGHHGRGGLPVRTKSKILSQKNE